MRVRHASLFAINFQHANELFNDGQLKVSSADAATWSAKITRVLIVRRDWQYSCGQYLIVASIRKLLWTHRRTYNRLMMANCKEKRGEYILS